MTCLGALHFLHVDSGARITSVRGAFQSRDLSTFTPEVGLAGIVVIGKAEGGAIFDDIAKVTAKLQPPSIVLKVIVNLVTGKEEYIDISSLYVVYNVLS